MAFKTATDLIDEAKQRITQITPQDVQAMQADGKEALYIDVREPNEWNLGRIPQAMHIPRGILESSIESRVPRDRKIVLYCASGNRSALAADTLQQMGYADVASMSGGFKGWVAANGEIAD
jgi:rhodanese-related sulfurtransferase